MFGAKLAPPFVEEVAQIWTSVLGMPSVSPEPPEPASFRASYQESATLPVDWSTAIDGMNWLFTVASSFTRTAGDQVAPLSSEYWTSMSVSLLSFPISCVQTAYSRPLWTPPLRSHARFASASIERLGWAGM